MIEKKPKIPSSRFCPRCASIELEDFIGFKTGQFKCKNCGYIGPVLEGDYNFIKKFKSNLSELNE